MMVIKHKNPFAKIKLCSGCRLKSHRRKQVIGRGDAPATILFIGEGPGKTEDLLGEPFVGPSGNLLDQMIQDASAMAWTSPPSYYITNMVLCRPWIWQDSDPDCGHDREPTKQEVLACMPNVMEIARIVKPKLVIFFGRVAESYYKKEFPDRIRITHPAAHLRYGGKSSPTYMQDIRTLSEVFRRVK